MGTFLEARKVGLPLMNLVRFKGLPILQQLHLEEELFRTSKENWCIVNDGTNDPTIVMGVSGKPAELLEIKPVLHDEIPVVRRFTGGGTVIVDQGTIFVTFICNQDAVPGLQPYPRPIMSWSSLIYDQVFRGIGDFRLRENDYVFGDRKFGGNAQSITKRRWLHHTSFLWDYEARQHSEFIWCLKDYLSRLTFIERTVNALGTHFSLKSVDSEANRDSSAVKFVPSTRLLTRQELEEAMSAADSKNSLAESISPY
ncbi:uncharacterized protein LOC116192774 isoform X2 [Punica granatum]|uniref:Uncharacterized protein LOC116192774 isoform X2 n=1 Tax=Punica granatum TaxID=22663 RepID=A0A6P8C3K5_PUNGR|nr:uncharacterized protein LOC116192774 isoform X2 [Punica granatum]